MYKCVLFDLDGTLADTLESIALAGNKVLEMLGLMPQSTENYKYYAGDGADTLIRRALSASGDTQGLLFEKAMKEYRDIFKTDCIYKVKAFPGIHKMLSVLKCNQIKIGVISNKPHQQTFRVVEEIFGKDFFDIIVGQREGVPKKPNPASTLAAAKELGVNSIDCIYVGDTNVDMQTGLGAGMFTVGVLWGFRDKEELETYDPQAIISTPEELIQFL